MPDDDMWTTCPGDDELSLFVQSCQHGQSYDVVLEAVNKFLSMGLPHFDAGSGVALRNALERRPVLDAVHFLFTGEHFASCVDVHKAYAALYQQVKNLRRSQPDVHGMWVVDEQCEGGLAYKMSKFVGRVEELYAEGVLNVEHVTSAV